MSTPTLKIHEQLTKDNWCQYSYAKTKDNKTTKYENSDAVKFCALSWIHKIYSFNRLLHINAHKKLLSIINSDKSEETSIGSWNDTSTFEEVQKAFQLADL